MVEKKNKRFDHCLERQLLHDTRIRPMYPDEFETWSSDKNTNMRCQSEWNVIVESTRWSCNWQLSNEYSESSKRLRLGHDQCSECVQSVDSDRFRVVYDIDLTSSVSVSPVMCNCRTRLRWSPSCWVGIMFTHTSLYSGNSTLVSVEK